MLIFTRIWNKVRNDFFRVLFRYDHPSKSPIRKRKALERLGSDYGGWYVPADILSSESICYCFGVGEDISFDLALMHRFKCDVFGFDPTPKVEEFVKREASEVDSFHFYPIGLWNENAAVKFFVPQNEEHISHSIINLQDTSDYFIAECKTLKTIMGMLGHEKLNLLKMDIEGAEYAVLNQIMEDNLSIDCISIEFHYREKGLLEQLRNTVQMLSRNGFVLVSVDNLLNYTFVNQELMN